MFVGEGLEMIGEVALTGGLATIAKKGAQGAAKMAVRSIERKVAKEITLKGAEK